MSTALRKPIVHRRGRWLLRGRDGCGDTGASLARGLRSPAGPDGNAPVEDSGRAIGGIEFPQGGDLRQEVSGVVAGGLGAGEARAEGRPGGIGADAVGVVWEGCAQIPLEAADGGGAWGAPGGIRQDWLRASRSPVRRAPVSPTTHRGFT